MRVFALMMGLAAGVAAAGAQTGHRVDFPLEAAQWEALGGVPDSTVSVMEYVPVGESAASWTRFVSVQLFDTRAVPFPGAGQALDESRRFLVGRCPGALWRPLDGSEGDRGYEWCIAGCPGEPDQTELGRVFLRGDVWARITFSVKGPMDEATRAEWRRRLSRARILEEPR